MPRTLAPFAASLVALYSACGAESPVEAQPSPSSRVLVAEQSFPYVRSIDANRHVAAASGPEARGATLWLQTFDAPEISAVAADGNGDLLGARSGTETLALDGSGAQLWSVPFGARVATGLDGSLYIAGGGESDRPFLLKLDSAGNLVYEAQLGAEASGAVDSLAVDSAGNVALSGPALGTAKLDATGAVSWQAPFAGQLAFDSQGNLWIAGGLEGSRDFGTIRLESRGGSDVLLLQLGLDGTPLLARSFGDAAALQRAEAIAVDAQDNLLVAGTFDGSVDFGAGALSSRPASCSSDAWCVTSGFVAKLDARTDALWSVNLGVTRAVPSVAVDSRGGAAVSSVLPGGVRPFRQPRLTILDAEGHDVWQKSEWPGTGIGGGRCVTIDHDDDVVWAVSARPSLAEEEYPYLAKLSN